MDKIDSILPMAMSNSKLLVRTNNWRVKKCINCWVVLTHTHSVSSHVHGTMVFHSSHIHEPANMVNLVNLGSLAKNRPGQVNGYDNY